MTNKNYQVGLLITGDAKKGVKATQLTRDGLKDLSTQQKKTSKSTKDLSSRTGSMIGKLGKVTSVLGLATATLGSMGTVMRTQTITEMKVMADTLNLSTQTLSEWTTAGEKYNVTGEKTADIFKDIQDKIGDLAATGGGEAKDIFEKLNLDIDEFVGLSADQQLLKVGAALDDVASHSEKIFYLEALANDASRLLPLLENGAFGLKTAQEEARLLGTSIDDIDAEMIAVAGREMQRMGDISLGLGNTITAAVSPALGAVTDSITDVVLSFGGWESIVDTTIDTTLKGIGVVLDNLKPLHVMLLTSQLGWQMIGKAATSAMSSSAEITADVINTVLEPFQALLWGIADGWGKILIGLGEFTGDERITGLGESIQGFAHDVSQFSVSADDIVAADKAMADSIENTKAAILSAKSATRGNDLITWYKKTTQAAKESAKATVAVKKAQRDLGNVIASDKGASTNQMAEDYEALIKQVDNFSGAWADAGNVMIDTFGSIAQQMDKMFAGQEKYTDALAHNRAEQAKGGKDLKKLKAEEIKLTYASTQAQLSSYGSIAGAAADMFGKKTAAAKILAATEQGIAIAQIALNVQKMLADNTLTASEVTNSGIRATAKGAEAVASAATAPWPIGLGLAAAMLAFLGSIGISLGGSGGGSGNGTGSASTVKGGGISESLSKANEGLEDIMIDQLAELRGLRSDITNVQNLSYGLLSSLLDVDVGHHEIKNATERELEVSIRGLNTGEASGNFTDELRGIFTGIDEAIEESVDVLGLNTRKSLANFVFEVGTISFDGLNAEDAGKRLDAVLSAQSDLKVESIAPFVTQHQQIGEGALETLVRVAKEQTIFNDNIDKFGLSISNISNLMKIDVAQSIIKLTGGLEKFSELSDSYIDNFFSDAERLEFLEKSLTEAFGSLGLTVTTSKEGFRALIEGIDATTSEGQALLAALLEINPALSDYIDELASQQQAITDFNRDITEQLLSLDFTPLQEKLYSLQNEFDEYRAEASELGIDTTLLETLYGRKRQTIIDDVLAEINASHQNKMETLTSNHKSEMEKLTGSHEDAVNDLVNNNARLVSAFSSLNAGIANSILAIRRQGGSWSESDYQTTQITSLSALLGQGSIDEQISNIDSLQKAYVNKYNTELDGLNANRDAAQSAYDEQLALIEERYQAELEVYSNMRSALDALKQSVDNLLLSDLSTLTNEQKLAESKSQYQSILAAAQSGDATAVSQLSSAQNNYLGEAQKYYASSSEYENIFNAVFGQVSAVSRQQLDAPGKANAPSVPLAITEHNARVEELQSSTLGELTQLRELSETLEQETQVAFESSINALDNTLKTNSALLVAELESNTLAITTQVQADAQRLNETLADQSIVVAEQNLVSIRVNETQTLAINQLSNSVVSELRAVRSELATQTQIANNRVAQAEQQAAAAESRAAELQRKLTEQARIQERQTDEIMLYKVAP